MLVVLCNVVTSPPPRIRHTPIRYTLIRLYTILTYLIRLYSLPYARIRSYRTRYARIRIPRIRLGRIRPLRTIPLWSTSHTTCSYHAVYIRTYMLLASALFTYELIDSPYIRTYMLRLCQPGALLAGPLCQPHVYVKVSYRLS